MASSSQLTGVGSPTGYTGVRSPQPPNFVAFNRAPTSGTVGKDIKNFSLGDIWLDTSADVPYMLVDMSENTPTWSQFASSGGGASDFVTDAGTATESGGSLNVLGGELLNTAGSGDTLTVNLDRGTNGQIIVAATGAASAYATVTSSNSTITITGGANTLDLKTAANVPISFAGDSGTATPALGVITLAGGNNLVSSASGSTVTFDLNGTTNHAVQVGNASNSLTSLSVGTNGQVLIGATGADPAFATLTSSGGTITFTPGANTLNLEASSSAIFPWTDVTGATQAMAVNNGYSANRATLVTFTLPATAAFGERIAVVGNGAGGWIIAQNASQTIHFNSANTTTGVAGSLASTVRYNTVELICTVANTDFVVRSASGNLTVV